MNPHEHRRLSFVLAFAMHGLIAAFVAFGVQWRTEPAAVSEVELWQGIQEGGPVAPPAEHLPEPVAIPHVTPPVDIPPAAINQVPDIVIEKQKPVAKPKVEAPKPKSEKKPDAKPADKPADKKQQLAQELSALAQKYGSKAGPGNKASDTAGKLSTTPVDATGALAGMAARQQAAEARARGGVEDAYKLAIRNKIRRNMNYPDDALSNPEVVYKVTLLPDMTVLDVVLVKASGNPAFDEAVKRAIQRTGEYPPLPSGLNFADWRANTLKYRLRD